jgi:Tol biopolymer transport system component
MTSQPRFERNVPALLEDLYLGSAPSYRNDLLAAVGGTRQRPAWSFPERWLPVNITNRLALAPRFPTRPLAIALVVLALLAAGLLWYAGTHPSLRPALPFGPAGNGGVVYALDGDIYLGDATAGTSHRITTTDDFDRNPLVSPDGTRVAFLRTAAGSTADSFDLVVADLDGSNARVISTTRVQDGDPGIWSADSTFLLMMNASENLYRYNVDGSPPQLVAHQAMPRAFLPPDGHQFIFEELAPGQRSLGVMSADGTNRRLIYTIPAGETADGCDYGAVLVTPDGSKVVFQRRPADESEGCRGFVMNIDGSGAHRLTTDRDVVFEGNLAISPDGSEIAFNRWNNSIGSWAIQPIGVVSVAGGAARSVGPTPVGDGAAFEWSPDGRTIISAPATVAQWPPNASMKDAHPVLIDVATGAWHEAPWTMSSWPTWQRLGGN